MEGGGGGGGGGECAFVKGLRSATSQCLATECAQWQYHGC